MTNGEPSTDPVVVIGGGMGGGRAAEFLASRGKLGGRLILVADELDYPYQRPPLSKDVTFGDPSQGVPERFFFRPESFYQSKGIDVRLGIAATALHGEDRVVSLSDGSQLNYSRALITTGCSPRALRVPGTDRDGVHYLRTLQDARSFWASAGVGPVVIIGGGFIGCEVASALREQDVPVTIVEASQEPLSAALGPEPGRRIRSLHEAQGVTFELGCTVELVTGAERVQGVRLSDGRTLEAATVLVSIGVTPNVEWLADSGIKLDNGIVVDDAGLTSVPDVYAAGDVARWVHPGFGSIRLEHETNAQAQAIVAARNILGQSTTHAAVPYVWSEQFGQQLEYVGHSRAWDSLEWYGDGPGFGVAYLRAGSVEAVLTYGRPEQAAVARGLLDAGPATVDQWTRAVHT